MRQKWISFVAVIMFANIATANTTAQISVNDTDTLAPIVDSKNAEHVDYIYERCHDFVLAVTAYSMIVASNPVHGKNPARKEPYLWAWNPDIIRTFEFDSKRDKYPDFIGKYLSLFGAITYPSPVLKLPIYLKDKKTCLSKHGLKDE